ncbi:MAG: helix-turn-helix domain-containing protein [Candidatus Omnitrophota bacterium]
MPEEKLLTVREVSHILGISEKEVVDFAEKGAIPAYKIGGVYLRFKKDQIQGFKKTAPTFSTKRQPQEPHSFKDRLSDFLYFNDFYIISILIISALLTVIFKGH